jgi:6-hydroxycyclohex-1-ene-1-carbonyl-CoA dehydrogenase
VGDPKATRKEVMDIARQLDTPSLRHKIFECSGTVPGQELAWSLMGHASTVGFVGYTIEKAQVRLSNLMAFDSTAFGTWGCPPDQYAPVLEMVKQKQIALAPFIEEAPLSRINEFLDGMAHHKLERRMVLIP